MSEIPYHKVYPFNNNDIQTIEKRLEDSLHSGMLTNDKWVKQLEAEIKKMYSVDYCIVTSNGTMGLYLCYYYYSYLKPLHLPNFTWESVDKITYYLWKEYHDIDKKTWHMNDFPKYGLISPSHTFGNIQEYGETKGKVIFDGAHAFGAKIKEIGDATVFSFAPTKTITTGEGGAIITNNKKFSEWLNENRNSMCRMTEMNAIVGLQLLKYTNDIMDWKKTVYNFYSSEIPGDFQEIPITSSYNTIGFLNTEHLIIPEHIKTKQYYVPIGGVSLLPNSYYVYKNICVLPSWFGLDCKKVVEDIWDVNKL